jgi:hypothetical protein
MKDIPGYRWQSPGRPVLPFLRKISNSLRFRESELRLHRTSCPVCLRWDLTVRSCRVSAEEGRDETSTQTVGDEKSI